MCVCAGNCTLCIIIPVLSAECLEKGFFGWRENLVAADSLSDAQQI